MTMATKTELLKGCLKRYLQAAKTEKTKILDELQAHTGMHRKALVRAFRRLQFRDARIPPKRRGRAETYGPDVTLGLRDVWDAASELCAERLQPILAEYVRILKRDRMWPHLSGTTQRLLAMSLATLKRRVAGFRTARRKARQATTRPDALHVLIPIRQGPWQHPAPGFGEVNTVVHCGQSLSGDVAYTVNYTDIATGWHEAAAQLNKGQEATLTGIQVIRARLPFPLRSLDPDSGSEFINWHLKGWCERQNIELSRSRPYHKNDNAHIEQKNGAIVRRFVGYRRIETPEQVALLNELYAGPLRLYVNFFQPSMQLISHERVGARYRRRYDQAQTPFQRVLARRDIPAQTKTQLTAVYETLNPLRLKAEVARLMRQIFNHA